MAARKELLRLSQSAWADALMEVALCERDLDDPFAAGTGAGTGAGAEDQDATGGSQKVTILFVLLGRVGGLSLRQTCGVENNVW